MEAWLLYVVGIWVTSLEVRRFPLVCPATRTCIYGRTANKWADTSNFHFVDLPVYPLLSSHVMNSDMFNFDMDKHVRRGHPGTSWSSL